MNREWLIVHAREPSISLNDENTLKITNYILTFFFLTLFCSGSFGTAQIPDILIYNGDTVSIYSNPLEQLPEIHSIRGKLYKPKGSHLNTACWRGYQAEWTIIDNQLFLTAIYSCNYSRDEIRADLKSIFGDKYVNGKVRANWVTANILSPQGKQIYYTHSGYQSLYEKEVIYKIEKGHLTGTKTYDNSKSRKSIYSQDTTLLRFIYSNIEWESLPEQDQPVRVFLEFSANEKGIVDSVIVLRGFDEAFDNEAVRVVKAIPEWDVFYMHGQHKRIPWIIPITYSEENRRKYNKD